MLIYFLVIIAIFTLLIFSVNNAQQHWRYFASNEFAQEREVYTKKVYALFENYRQTENNVTAISIINSNCLCSQYFKAMQSSLSAYAVANVTLDLAHDKLTPAQLVLIPSTPALLVLSKDYQHISYLGPHNNGYVCGEGTAMLDVVLSQLNTGINPQYLLLDHYGCFCPV
ncbi:hypothetical protein C2869_00735 [Saccharobesus litoralis]|uniref:DUF6436 domain-containing protein n=1 Tax=Saccharobesus litoralis TaxID=2172099 RepID=A0A2S0VLG3_9ALTE|nr:DUF6436 domain-containing protein [Saccharobesus litoralis]AWB65054.1 hypothetical protein C2869_00735 [Saccharobesus litoralis]